MSERQKIMASDLSLMHVYFKELHVRKYLREENFGTVDAIGNCMLFITTSNEILGLILNILLI